MTKILLPCLLVFSTSLSAQKIQGKVTDSETKEIIPYANVYFNAGRGTSSDATGYFEIDTLNSQGRPIVISAVGYVSQTLSDYKVGKPLTIRLEPHVTLLNEIVVKPDEWPEEKKNKTFIRQFLGTSPNARKTEIRNWKDIELKGFADTLLASADKPLIIDNKALGYRITYFLADFRSCNRSLEYKGNFFFQEDTTLSASEQRKVAKRRESAYLGSEMHFFRALWKGRLKQEKYKVLGGNYQPLTYDDFVILENGRKYIAHLKELIIIYDQVEQSRLTLTSKVFFDKNGYFDPEGIKWSGAMVSKRVGDLLPFEYEPPIREEKRAPDYKKIGMIRRSVLPPFHGDLLGKINHRIDLYNKHYHQEKVYIHTDKPYYNSGETIWFKVYHREAFSLKPIPVSSLIHVELIDANETIVASRVIKTVEGSGKGDFYLADSLNNSLAPGKYLIRAYTHFQRNFDHPLFSRTLDILSTYHSNPNRKEESRIISSTHSKDDSIVLTFYPEGGHLIQGLHSRIAFKSVGQTGKGMPVKGSVYDHEGQLIADIQSDQLGLGIFALTPRPNTSYHVVLDSQISSVASRYQLPNALENGYTLRVDNLLKDMMTIKATSNTASGLDKVLIVGQLRGGVFFHIAGNAGQNVIMAKVPKTGLLLGGVAHITLFGPDDLAYCERLAYLDSEYDQAKVTLKTDKKAYSRRAPVTIAIDTDEEEADMSVTVTDLHLVRYDSLADNIKTNLLLTSDVRGTIENSNYYFQNNRQYELDLVMMTHGWRSYSWKKLLNDEFPSLAYLPENGVRISGKLQDPFDPQKEIHGRVTLASFNNLLNTHEAITGQNGRFSFDLPHDKDSNHFFLRAEKIKQKRSGKLTKGSEYVRIILDEVCRPEVTPVEMMKLSGGIMPKSTQGYVRQSEKVRYYADTSFLLLKNTVIMEGITVEARKVDPFEEFGAIYDPSSRLVMDSLGTVALAARNVFELLQGRVAGVQVRQEGFGYRISIRGGGTPLFLFNNMPVDSFTVISIPPSMIHHVDVLKGPETAIYGSRGANGVIALFSKRGKHFMAEEEAKATNTARYVHEGYYRAKEFYAPNYASQDTLPEHDHRTTLFWKPDVRTSAGGKAKIQFFTSDDMGRYQVRIEGITKDGHVILEQSVFEVGN